jgi:hypothetical protein
VPADPELRRRGGLARRLVGAPARVRRAATAAATSTPAPGDWTAQQIVLHLVAVEIEVFQRRLLDLSQMDAPPWAWAEPGPADMGSGETIAESMIRFARARLATLEWVGALDEAGWRRVGRHVTLGTLDVTGLLTLAADHDADHLASLVKLGRLRRSARLAGPPP